jgi:hypothetical protein
MWFEERETQAAELWRITGLVPVVYRYSGDAAFLKHHLDWRDLGNRVKSVMCVCASYANILGSDSIQAVQKSNFQLESLILAQNERWRQA